MISRVIHSPRRSVVTTISERQSALGLSDEVVARATGYPNTEIYVLVKRGQAKLSIERVNPLADALRMNRAELMSLVLAEYEPALLTHLESAWGPLVPRG